MVATEEVLYRALFIAPVFVLVAVLRARWTQIVNRDLHMNYRSVTEPLVTENPFFACFRRHLCRRGPNALFSDSGRLICRDALSSCRMGTEETLRPTYGRWKVRAFSICHYCFCQSAWQANVSCRVSSFVSFPTYSIGHRRPGSGTGIRPRQPLPLPLKRSTAPQCNWIRNTAWPKSLRSRRTAATDALNDVRA